MRTGIFHFGLDLVGIGFFLPCTFFFLGFKCWIDERLIYDLV